MLLITYDPIRNPTLEFVAAPALAPAEVAVDENLMKTYEAELKKVRSFDDICFQNLIFLYRLKLFLYLKMKMKKIFKDMFTSSLAW